jgi:transcriptional regulator with XRE-family HTH domain
MGIALGQHIKTLRKELKMSALKLSKDVGISKSYLDYIESGAREPHVDVLVKVAAALKTPLAALLNIQKREQLETAINKWRTENTNISDADLRAVARTADGGLAIDEQALAMTQEAFRDSNNVAKLAEVIENEHLRAIVKAGAELTNEDLEKLRKVMEFLYPDEFRK